MPHHRCPRCGRTARPGRTLGASARPRRSRRRPSTGRAWRFGESPDGRWSSIGRHGPCRPGRTVRRRSVIAPATTAAQISGKKRIHGPGPPSRFARVRISVHLPGGLPPLQGEAGPRARRDPADGRGDAAAAGEVLGGPGTPYERIEAYLRHDRDVLRCCPIGRLTMDPDVVSSPELRAPVDDTLDWLRVRAGPGIRIARRVRRRCPRTALPARSPIGALEPPAPSPQPSAPSFQPPAP